MTAATRAVKGRMLKVGFGELVGLVGGIEAAAACCRVSKSMVARYASLSPADDTYFAPIDVVRCLEAVAGEPVVTQLLALEAGASLVIVPDTSATEGDLLTLLARQARESGELTTELCTGLADGKLSAAEARKAMKEAEQLAQVAMQMRAVLSIIVRDEQ